MEDPYVVLLKISMSYHITDPIAQQNKRTVFGVLIPIH